LFELLVAYGAFWDFIFIIIDGWSRGHELEQAGVPG